MKRFIYYTVVHTQGEAVARLTIVDQGARRDDLTEHGRMFTASNGVSLRSAAHPQYATRADDSILLYVRGGRDQHDDKTLVIPVKNMELIRAALDEYNAKYDGCATITMGHTESCAALGAGTSAADLTSSALGDVLG
jgi:hypothetical protein